MEVLQISQFEKHLKPRKRDAHKGDFGHVLVVGGNLGYLGAVSLAAQGALRVGAGLVSVVARPEYACFLNASCPEVMYYPADSLDELIEKATVIALGPGLGQDDWGMDLWGQALESNKILIVDADALNILAQEQQAIKRANWILTPHPGEAARLLKITTQDIQSDRLEALKKLQTTFDGVIVLKGAGTLISGGDHQVTICEAGNPGMASGGMGDLLTGIISGFVAQQFSLIDSAKMGVLMHALAGDLAARDYGERGLIASDLIKYLRRLVNWNDDD